jgi:hypothetical protein
MGKRRIPQKVLDKRYWNREDVSVEDKKARVLTLALRS